MKKEEAIKRLTDMHKLGGLIGLELEDRQALSMGIDALEVEPCEDWYDIPSSEMTLEQARQAVRDLRQLVMNNRILPKLQPCEDAVSRQAVLNSINANCVYENEYNLTAKRIKNAVEQLPSVTPKEPILDKIRAEIEQLHLIGYAIVDRKREIISRAVLQILDKYKAESEGK